MPEPYQVPVARLWSDEGSVVGAGFLAPCGEIRLDLPWAAGKTQFRGSIVA